MSATHGEVLLDAHVHFHAGFAEGAFFDAALRNFADARPGRQGAGSTGGSRGSARGSSEIGSESRTNGRRGADRNGAATVFGLMLTESHGIDTFGRWEKGAMRDLRDDGSVGSRAGVGPQDGGWTFRTTAERNSLWAFRAGAVGDPGLGARLLVIAGRQIVTEERLEVLALGCRREFPEDLPLRQARDAVIAAGGIPVIPWGFGKWWGARGRLLGELIEADSPGIWFLGDNAGRPRLSPRPKLFEAAARRGIWVLPGSDPLPLAGQERRVGRCGFVLPRPERTARAASSGNSADSANRAAGPADSAGRSADGTAGSTRSGGIPGDRPAAAVLDALRRCGRQPQTFGRYESLGRFVRQQVAMQLRGRSL